MILHVAFHKAAEWGLSGRGRSGMDGPAMSTRRAFQVDHWYDEKGRWCARHVCGDPPHVSEWLGHEIVSNAPVWVELHCGFCHDKFVTVVEA